MSHKKSKTSAKVVIVFLLNFYTLFQSSQEGEGLKRLFFSRFWERGEGVCLPTATESVEETASPGRLVETAACILDKILTGRFSEEATHIKSQNTGALETTSNFRGGCSTDWRTTGTRGPWATSILPAANPTRLTSTATQKFRWQPQYINNSGWASWKDRPSWKDTRL